jgi:hypothetical protein
VKEEWVIVEPIDSEHGKDDEAPHDYVRSFERDA